jgi:hypothetical protein
MYGNVFLKKTLGMLDALQSMKITTFGSAVDPPCSWQRQLALHEGGKTSKEFHSRTTFIITYKGMLTLFGSSC